MDKLLAWNLEYNSEVVDANMLRAVLEYNKDELAEAIADIDKWRPRINSEEVLYRLKKVFEKRVKVIEYADGVQSYIVGNISDKGAEIADTTQTKIYVPRNDSEEPLAYITFKDYIRVPKFQEKLRRLESLMKRSKIRFDKSKAKVNGENTVQYKVRVADDNEKFWHVLGLLGRG